MQAVILAGGLGMRLKPLTEQIPKVMVAVNGKPFLLHLLELLKSWGVNDIVLCIGYLGRQVRDFFGGGGDLGIRIRYSEEGEWLLGTGGALKQAQNLLDDHFFVVNGDTCLPLDYRQVEGSFIKHNKTKRDLTSLILLSLTIIFLHFTRFFLRRNSWMLQIPFPVNIHTNQFPSDSLYR